MVILQKPHTVKLISILFIYSQTTPSTLYLHLLYESKGSGPDRKSPFLQDVSNQAPTGNFIEETGKRSKSISKYTWLRKEGNAYDGRCTNIL